MQPLPKYLRRMLPSTARLSHNRILMWPLDLIDRIASLPFKEARGLPPNRMRIRVGVQNRILFNAFQFRYRAVGFWMRALAQGLVRLDSNVLDIGCGCGRHAIVLRDLRWGGTRFEGLYTGIDIDAEMVRWCQHHFPAKRFQFICADHHSTVYNPGGRKNERYRVPLDDQSQDYVFSTSLFTHLLEEDLLNYIRESFRALKSGAVMEMTVFCLDSIGNRLGGRWTFNHRIGEARVENPKMPEAAVAYTKDYLLSRCRQVGFREAAMVGTSIQTILSCRK